MTDLISTIIKAITENPYKIYGIRGDDRELMSKGEYFGNSKSTTWDEEECELGGTCAIGFGCLWFDGSEEDVNTIKQTIKLMEGYDYEHWYLVTGDNAEYGNDPGEQIITNCSVVEILK